jgi:D-serine deaminase-like pyridoxal phosphate-dependent protein
MIDGRQMKTNDLRTPALLLDLDSMESNLWRMANYFRNRLVGLRPHFKNHQVLSLAAKQLQAGAVGVTCARLEHAESLVEQGLGSILIANEIAGESMIERFVDLSRRAPVLVAVDNACTVVDMAKQAGNRAHELNVVVDLDLRLRRCGVEPGAAALSLAKLVLEKGLKFRGLMGYPGSFRLAPGAEKERAVRSDLRPLIETKALIERAGIPVEIVTCGGTGDYSITATFPEVTEIQAGSYLLMDTEYAPFAPDFKPALSVLGTVISKPSGQRLVANTGAKALSCEKGLPKVKGIPGLRVEAMHAEHVLIEIVDPAAALEIGDVIELWVHYLDSTIQLHDRMYGVRNGEVEETLQIEH